MAISNQTLVAAIIVVLFAAGIYVFLQQKQAPEQEFIKTETGDEYRAEEYYSENEINPLAGIDDVSFQEAKTSQDCDKMQDYYLRGDCYSNLAIINSDVSFCGTVKEQGQQDTCLYNVALQTNDTSICLQMSFDITDCLTQIAVNNLDPSACELSAYEKEQCINAAIAEDFSQCTHLGYNRKICNDAVDQKNIALCENIIDASKNCFFELAKAALDPQYCAKTEPTVRNTCIFIVATTAKNAGYCNLLSEDRGNCIATIAVATNNRALCEQAGTERQSCIEDLS